MNNKVRRIDKELQKFSYVVGSKLQVDQDESIENIYHITVCIPIHNSNTRRKMTKAMAGMSIPVSEDALFCSNGRVRVGTLKDTLATITRILALHEVDEWLKYNDQRLYTPHFAGLS